MPCGLAFASLQPLPKGHVSGTGPAWLYQRFLFPQLSHSTPYCNYKKQERKPKPTSGWLSSETASAGGAALPSLKCFNVRQLLYSITLKREPTVFVEVADLNGLETTHMGERGRKHIPRACGTGKKVPALLLFYSMQSTLFLHGTHLFFNQGIFFLR